ncbi:hypothetical protein PIB30_100978 [Stylosanthes scabra]|uniref:Uncharacterized protein n=1 Tax=Stylosanthes scabra TaxID=79078 RepID=A0ABU6RXG9_9FABA|nr:hypothetical protein [Stylosanthes scabra]
MENAKSMDTPMSTSCYLDKDEKGKEVDMKKFRGERRRVLLLQGVAATETLSVGKHLLGNSPQWGLSKPEPRTTGNYGGKREEVEVKGRHSEKWRDGEVANPWGSDETSSNGFMVLEPKL